MKRSLRASIHSSDWLHIKENSRALRFPSLRDTFFHPHRREERKMRVNKKRNLRARERASALLSPVSRDALDSAPNSRSVLCVSYLHTNIYNTHVPFFLYFFLRRCRSFLRTKASSLSLGFGGKKDPNPKFTEKRKFGEKSASFARGRKRRFGPSAFFSDTKKVTSFLGSLCLSALCARAHVRVW